MSSPSGRRKFQDRQNQRIDARSSDRDQHLLNGYEAIGNGQEDENDEETLMLKLAAIEARLKLKRLQQNKARLKLSSSEVEGDDLRLGTSSTVGSTASRSRNRFLDRKRKITDVTHHDG